MPIRVNTARPNQSNPALDLTDQSLTDVEAVETAKALNSHTNLDFDGDPLRLTWQEFQAALKNPYVYPEAKQALWRLRANFVIADGRDKPTTPQVRRPEEAAAVGDTVKSPSIDFSVEQVLLEAARLNRQFASDPTLRGRLQAGAYPYRPQDQLRWAIARTASKDQLTDSLWNAATNDNSAAMLAYVRGVLGVSPTELSVSTSLEQDALAASELLNIEAAQDAGVYTRVADQPFPVTLAEQFRWASALVSTSWNYVQDPRVAANPKAEAVIRFVAGALVKQANNLVETPVVSERRTLVIDGDTRVYAIHTPPGPMPTGGWPTVFLFHGSYGGHCPEQMETYQQINAIADARGVQVVYPVGLPQDRADATQTGRGMLNWDPVGAGPGGRNDRFVLELLDRLVKNGDVDRSRAFIAGHSQGGFYVSNLVASYPKTFAAATIFGAGTGSVAAQTDFSQLSRKTPLLLYVGENDIHLPMAQDLVKQLRAQNYGSALTFTSPKGRGHEVVPYDYEAMFDYFDQV